MLAQRDLPLPALMPADPTGLSSTAGQLVIFFGLLAALLVLIRWWRRQRNR